MLLQDCGLSTRMQQGEQIGGERGLTKPQRIAADDLRQPASTEKVGRVSLLRQLEKQGYRCALTGEALTPENAGLDHKTPISRGGSHSISNVEIITQRVNAAKGSMTREEFIQLCMDVVAYHNETS